MTRPRRSLPTSRIIRGSTPIRDRWYRECRRARRRPCNPFPRPRRRRKASHWPKKITSFLPDRLDSLAKKITSFLPEGRIRDKAQDIVKGAIEKGLTAGLDGLLKNAGVNESDRKAIGKAAEAAIEQKPGGN